MTVAIRKVLPEEVAELKVISEDTFRETFAHDNTESQLQAYFDTALSRKFSSMKSLTKNHVIFSFWLMVKRQVF